MRSASVWFWKSRISSQPSEGSNSARSQILCASKVRRSELSFQWRIIKKETIDIVEE